MAARGSALVPFTMQVRAVPSVSRAVKGARRRLPATSASVTGGLLGSRWTCCQRGSKRTSSVLASLRRFRLRKPAPPLLQRPRGVTDDQTTEDWAGKQEQEPLQGRAFSAVMKRRHASARFINRETVHKM